MAKNETAHLFGKGLVYSLALFADHFSNETAADIFQRYFVMTHKDRDLILSDTPDDRHNYGFNKEVKWWYEHIVPIWGTWQKTLHHDIQLWFNGASDHLYEISTKGSKLPKDLKNRIATLANVALDAGHGSGLMNGNGVTYRTFKWAQYETYEILKRIDRFLGVSVVSCSIEQIKLKKKYDDES